MHSLFIASCNSLCILLISENVLVLTKYACAEIWKSKKNTFLGANEVPTPHKGGGQALACPFIVSSLEKI